MCQAVCQNAALLLLLALNLSMLKPEHAIKSTRCSVKTKATAQD